MKKDNRLFAILILALVILFVLYSLGYFAFPAYQGEIEFRLGRTIITESGETEILLHVQTKEDYPQLGYTIQYNIIRNEDLTKIILEKVNNPSGGPNPDMLGPAELEETIKLNKKEHILEFHSAKGVDSYKLTVRDNNVSIESIRSTFSKLKN